jgi:hypothetical protein
MMAILAGLTPAEQKHAERLVSALTPEERAAWLIELAALSVPEALVRVRQVMQPSAATNGGAP